jgi:hypothetical protein
METQGRSGREDQGKVRSAGLYHLQPDAPIDNVRRLTTAGDPRRLLHRHRICHRRGVFLVGNSG